MSTLEELRDRARLTRDEVALKLEVTATSIRNWETGRTEPTMTPAKYLDLLNLYNCSPEELAAATALSMANRQKLKPGRPRKVR